VGRQNHRKLPPKGSFFYRFIISPDPKREDHNHDLDMRDIAEHTMVTLEESRAKTAKEGTTA
jgi:hypothetical protein